MASPAASLARLLLASGPQAERVASSLTDEGGWPAAIAIAQGWRVLPQLGGQIRRHSWKLEPAAAGQLRVLELQAAAQSGYAARRAAELFAALPDIESAAAFKGIAVMARLYGRAAERMVQDIDLLVSPSEVPALIPVLQGLGFRPAAGLSPSRLSDFLQRQPAPTHEVFLLTDGDGLGLDLHTRLGAAPPPEMEVPRLLERSGTVRLGRGSVRSVSPLDAVALTAEHSLRDRFARISAVRDLCDLKGWFVRRPELWSGVDWVEHLRRCRLEVTLLAQCQLLASLDEEGSLPELRDRLAGRLGPSQRRRAARLERLARQQIFWGPLERDLFRVVSVGALRRFLAGRLWPGRSDEEIRAHLSVSGPRRTAWRRVLRVLAALVRGGPGLWLDSRLALTEHRRFLLAARKQGPP